MRRGDLREREAVIGRQLPENRIGPPAERVAARLRESFFASLLTDLNKNKKRNFFFLSVGMGGGNNG